MTAAPSLAGQRVLVIGGSAGIGLETARQAAAAGAEVIVTGRRPGPLAEAAAAVGAVSTATFDAGDDDALAAFFMGLDAPVDHVLVTAGGPYYESLKDMDFARARRALAEHPMVMAGVARHGALAGKVTGSMAFMGGTGARHPGIGMSSAMTAALPALTASMAVEVAPVRVNLIAAGFVDTPLSASLLGDQLDARREQLASRLPIGRVVGAQDVAALAVHLMVNSALTGATYDIDGGQSLLSW